MSGLNHKAISEIGQFIAFPPEMTRRALQGIQNWLQKGSQDWI